ncbi:MAG: glycosyltransferase, partial [Clostridia bacterium]|nr:glycosyltransferase [Clostridia bacterium]
MDISVIIPVYNTEKYLSECLESVRKLTELLSVEVIMIDDGSTDRSGEIAEEYAAAHPCFCCVHQENAGMSAVRNRGVSLARGKYLLFVDSDDYIIAEVYARMFETAEKNGTDLTVCDAVQLKDKKYVKFQNTIHAFHNLTDSITHITKHPALIYDTSPCNKLILHSFYIEIGLTFPVGLYYEDVIWTLMLYHRTNAVSVVREIGYVYRIRSGGTDQSITQKMFQAKNMDDKENVTHQVFEYLQREFPAPQLWLEAQRCHWTYHYGS